MTETYYPFDAGAGAGIPTEDIWERLFYGLQLDGVVAGYPSVTPNTTELQGYGDSSGLQVKVRAGAALIRGRTYYSDAEQTKAIATADATNPRIDLVVLRIDRSANTIAVAVVTGTPAGSPAEPALTQNATTHEIPLAAVAVAAGATSIAAGNVTDRRQWSVPNSRGLPIARVWRSTNQSIAHSTLTAVQFDTAQIDTGQFWASTANTRLTCKRAGVYRFHANARFAANATGSRQWSIRVNGTTIIGTDWRSGSSATEQITSSESGPYAMAAGDYVELIVFQSSGDALNLEVASAYSPILTAEPVRATGW